MTLYYFRCDGCDYMFLSGTNLENKTLICGEGCGGTLHCITEEEALSKVENMNE